MRSLLYHLFFLQYYLRAWEAVNEGHRKRRKKSNAADFGDSSSSSNGNKGLVKKQNRFNPPTGFRSLLRKAPKSGGSLHRVNGSGSGSDSSSSSRAGYRSRLGSSEEVRDESEMVVTSYTKPEKQRHHHHHHRHHRHTSGGGGGRPKDEKFSRH